MYSQQAGKKAVDWKWGTPSSNDLKAVQLTLDDLLYCYLGVLQFSFQTTWVVDDSGSHTPWLFHKRNPLTHLVEVLWEVMSKRRRIPQATRPCDINKWLCLKNKENSNSKRKWYFVNHWIGTWGQHGLFMSQKDMPHLFKLRCSCFSLKCCQCFHSPSMILHSDWLQLSRNRSVYWTLTTELWLGGAVHRVWEWPLRLKRPTSVVAK